MELLLFAGLVIVFFWAASLSSRVASLENKLRGAHQPSSNPQPVVQAIAAPKPPMEAAPAMAERPAVDAGENATNWLTIIGVLALIFGVGFFVKYAIDMGWISE